MQRKKILASDSSKIGLELGIPLRFRIVSQEIDDLAFRGDRASSG